MTEPLDPFGDVETHSIPRDRYDRPMIMPNPNHRELHPNCKVCAAHDAKMGKSKKLEDTLRVGEIVPHPYTRASTLASYIENNTHITRWKMRILCRAMGWNPDLAALAAGETYNTRIGMPDRDPDNAASGKMLDKLIDRALDRMFILEKADWGTAVHLATEPGFEGMVQDRMLADVESFKTIVSELGIKIVGTELFTVNDVTMSAGTFDHLMWVPGYGFLITDKKTSAKVDGPHFAIQLAGYANGERFDPETGERSPLETLTDGEEVNRKVGLIFWIKQGKTEVWEVNLELGWEGAQIAAGVRDYNQEKHPGNVTEKIHTAADEARQQIFTLISDCKNPGAVRSLYRAYSHLWLPTHTAAAKLRVAELEAENG